MRRVQAIPLNPEDLTLVQPGQESSLDFIIMTGREFDRIMSAVTRARASAETLSGLSVDLRTIEQHMAP